MTIEHARKRLGKKAERMTDKDIQDLINYLTRMVNKVINSVVKPNE